MQEGRNVEETKNININSQLVTVWLCMTPTGIGRK